MAKLNFEFSNGTLTATGANTYVRCMASDYAARTVGDGVKIEFAPTILDSRLPTFSFKYDDVTIEGTSYGSIALLVAAFNMKAGAKYAYNTKYPETLISYTLDPDTSVEAQLFNLQKGGWLTVKAPSTNTGSVFIGGDDVNNTDGYLEASGEQTFEIDDLSKLWVLATTPGDKIIVFGAYKD
jgi:hypothetical protein